MLRDAQERHVAGGKVCDLPMGGIYLVRGENLAMLGELVRARCCKLAVVMGLEAHTRSTAHS